MKRFVLLNVFILISLVGYSQIPLGIKAGVTTNEIVFRMPSTGKSWPYDYKTMTSFHIGIFSKVKLSEKLNFYPELQFIQKFSYYHYVSYEEVKLSYIELPLTISYQPVKWFAFESGGSIAINIRDNTFYKNYNSTDAGVVGGFRFSLTKNLSILTRYYHGLTSIGPFTFNISGLIPDKNYKAYNQTFQFSIAYYLKGNN